MLLIAANCYSYDFEVDGYAYNLISAEDLTCEITYHEYYGGYTDYIDSTKLIVPSSVQFNGKTLKVIGVGKKICWYANKLEKVLLPEGIEYISQGAFHGCKKLQSINIPSSVTKIDKEAFGQNESLESININPDNLNYTSIDGVVFSKDRTKLLFYPGGKECETYETPEGCNEIEDYVFKFAKNPHRIILGKDINKIGENAFESAIGLKYIFIGKNVKTISNNAFFWASNLKTIIIEDGESALTFEYPTRYNLEYNNGTGFVFESVALDSLYIGRNIQWTSSYSISPFASQTSIKYLGIGENVTNIYSFTQCPKIASIDIYTKNPPSFVDSKGGFTNATFLNAQLSIPYNSIEKYKSTNVWSSFWNITEMENNTKAESVSIVTSINNVVTDVSGSSIIKCIGCDPFILSANVLPEDTRNNDVQWSSSVPSVATIDAYGTVNIIGIGETTITTSTTDGSDKSASCKLIVEKAINLKDTDIELVKGGVWKLTAMTSEGLWDKTIIWTSSNENVAKVSSTGEVVAVGKGNTIITATAANNETATCTVKVISYECGDNLTWAISEDGTLTISGSGDMDNYSSSNAPWADYRKKINNIVIGDEVTSIGDYAFEDCTNVKSIKIGSSVTKIGDSAFHYCENLSEIIIPNSVVSIGEEAFYHCESATSLQLGNSLSKVGNSAFEGCYKIKSVEIPKSLTAISYGMFSNCESLKDIKFPNTLTSIGSYAFEYCESLESLHLPSSLNYIGYEAFYNCKNLFDVHCAAEKINDTNKDAFESTPIEQCVLYVPEKSVLYYSLREPWKYFGAILAEDESNDIQRVITLDEYNEIYTINGAKLSKPRKGMNIIKTSNGLIRKVNIK